VFSEEPPELPVESLKRVSEAGNRIESGVGVAGSLEVVVEVAPGDAFEVTGVTASAVGIRNPEESDGVVRADHPVDSQWVVVGRGPVVSANLQHVRGERRRGESCGGSGVETYKRRERKASFTTVSTTDNEPAGADHLAKIQRYRRLMYASIVVGVVAFIVADELGYSLVGLAVYWAGIVAFFAIWKGTSVTLFDERDTELERRASHVTVGIVGVLGVLTFTSMVVVGETATVEIPQVVWNLFLGYALLFVLWGVVYTVLKYR
jgi:hypothetical protein